MFERCTESAKRAVFRARLEAGCRSGDSISTVHLLLGLVFEEKPRAHIAVPLKKHADAICAHLGLPKSPKGKYPGDWRKEMPLDGNARLALTYAAQEADQDQQYWIDTDHLLIALLRFPNEASPALESIPLDLATVRAASRRHREKFPPAPAPSTSVVRVIFETLKPPLIMLAWITLFGLVMTLIIRWLNY